MGNVHLHRIKNVVNVLRYNGNIKKGLLYTLFSAINNGISFVLLLLLAGFLSPSDYGSLNLYNTFVSIISIVISFGTIIYIGTAFFQKKHEELLQVIIVGFGTSTLVLGLLSIVIAMFGGSVESVVGIPLPYIFIGLTVCYFQVITNTNLDIWRLEEKPVSYGVFSLTVAAMNFVVTIAYVIMMHYGWTGRVYAQFIVAAMYFAVSCVYLIKRGYLVLRFPSRAIVIETFAFGLPLVPHMASFWLKQGMDRYIINYCYSSEEVGLYSFALNFASIINIIGTAFNANNSVVIYKSLANGYITVKAKLHRVSHIMIFVFLGVFILVYLGAMVFVPAVFPDYTGGMVYLLPVCLGAFFQCLYLLYVNYLFFYKYTRQLMYITFTTALLQLSLSLWLTQYSIMWTAYISMAVSALTMALVYLYSKKILTRESIES